MKILLINDDGIDAPGLWAAARALRQSGDVFVVAPGRQQSGVGASLTLHSPLQVRDVPAQTYLAGDGDDALHSVTAYAVEGTPGDSCILALESIVGAVDLVVSGINPGSNLGWDVMVSGTVGGALQGYVRGFSTVAISVGAVQNPHLEVAAQLLQHLSRRLRDDPPASCFFLNINVPNLAMEQIPEFRLPAWETAPTGKRYAKRVWAWTNGTGLPRNRPIPGNPLQDTDIWAMKNNRISVTPLRPGMSSSEELGETELLLGDLPAQLLGRGD